LIHSYKNVSHKYQQLMNNVSLEDFKRELNQVREYLKHIELVNEVSSYSILDTDNPKIKELLAKFQNHHRAFEKDKKIFEYKAIIISLYGLLEKFIEIWIKEYLDKIAQTVNYQSLNEKIREKHFELSMKLISMITENKWDKYKHLKKEDILKNLYQCIEIPDKYKFNTNAFTIQSGNLQHRRITDIFDNLAINLNDFLVKNDSLNKEIGFSKDKIVSSEKDVLYSKMNELVERRNLIAHGSERIDDLLTPNLLKVYISFLEKYSQAIYQALEQSYFEEESTHKYQKINIIDVFNKSIIAFELDNYLIKEGEYLIIRTVEKSNNLFYKKAIISLQKDNESYSQLMLQEKTNIAIKIEGYLTIFVEFE